MKFLKQKHLDQLKPIGYYAEFESKDIIVPIKIFNPIGVGTWWIYEYDPESNEAMCFALLDNPDFAELGYIFIKELEDYTSPFGTGIEVDDYYEPQKLNEIISEVKNG